MTMFQKIQYTQACKENDCRNVPFKSLPLYAPAHRQDISTVYHNSVRIDLKSRHVVKIFK